MKFLSWAIRILIFSVCFIFAIPIVAGMFTLILLILFGALLLFVFASPFAVWMFISTPFLKWTNKVLDIAEGGKLYTAFLNKIKKSKGTTIH